MSVRASSWVASLRGIKAAPKSVLWALANRADKNGVAFPGIRLLADETGCCVRSVRVHLAWLEAAGLIVREHRCSKTGRQTSNTYRLQLHRAGPKIRGAESAPSPLQNLQGNVNRQLEPVVSIQEVESTEVALSTARTHGRTRGGRPRLAVVR